MNAEKIIKYLENLKKGDFLLLHDPKLGKIIPVDYWDILHESYVEIWVNEECYFVDDYYFSDFFTLYLGTNLHKVLYL